MKIHTKKSPELRNLLAIVPVAALLLLGAGCATTPRGPKQVYPGIARPMDQVALITGETGAGGGVVMRAVDKNFFGSVMGGEWPNHVAVLPGEHTVQAVLSLDTKVPYGAGLLQYYGAAVGQRMREAADTMKELAIDARAGREYIIRYSLFGDVHYWVEDSATGEVVSGERLNIDTINGMNRDEIKAVMANTTTMGRQSILMQSTNKEVVVYVLSDPASSSLHDDAARALTDQDMLAQLAADTNRSFSVRMPAIQKLEDQSVLAGIARDESDEICRKYSIGHLSVRAVLEEIAADESDKKFAKVARKRIKYLEKKGGFVTLPADQQKVENETADQQ